MDTLTTVGLLQSLPIILCAWSFLVVIWGAIASTLMYQLSKKTASRRPIVLRQGDKYTLLLVSTVNIFLTWYLIQFDSTSECASWVAVINVFYTAHLICVSIDITRWWSSMKSSLTPNTSNTLQL